MDYCFIKDDSSAQRGRSLFFLACNTMQIQVCILVDPQQLITQLLGPETL